MPERVALGIDIGGTSVRAALIAADGRILHSALGMSGHGRQGSTERLLDMLREMRNELCRQSGTAPSVPIGVCLPGIRDARGVMIRAVNLPFLEGVDVGAALAGAFGQSVRIETDVNAAAFAQWRQIEPRAARLVYLSLGTGVGGGVILSGEMVRHTRHGPGHLGHLIVDASAGAPSCRCGARGCLEAHVGGWAIKDDAKTTLARPHALAVGLVQIAHLYAPDCIAVGGGVIEHDAGLLAEAVRQFEARRGALVPPELRIIRAPRTSDEAGVIGAGLLALGENAGSAGGAS